MIPITPFLVWTIAGSLIWTALLTVAGMVLGRATAMLSSGLTRFQSRQGVAGGGAVGWRNLVGSAHLAPASVD